MQPEDVKAALKAWGHATVNRFALSGSDRSTNVLASNLRNLPVQSKSNDDRELLKRDGRSRRMRMAGALRGSVKDGNGGIRMVFVPLWACDPIPARNDADRPHDNPEAAVDLGIPDDLRWVDALVMRIERQNPLRGLVLRIEYTETGNQVAKAKIAGRAYAAQLGKEFIDEDRLRHMEMSGEQVSEGMFVITKDMYRRQLEKAIDAICWERSRAA